MLIESYDTSTQYRKALETLTEIEKEIKPAVAHFAALIRVGAAHGDLGFCLNVYKRYVDGHERYSPDLLVTMIDAFGKNGLVDHVTQIFDFMRAKKIEMDTSTYNLVMEVYANAGRKDDLLRLFEEMTTKKIRKDATTFNHIVKFVDFQTASRIFHAHFYFHRFPLLLLQIFGLKFHC